MSVMPCIVFGQNIKYSYDNAGNRIKKEIVMNTRAISKEESSKECYSYMLLERNIRIYPNSDTRETETGDYGLYEF